MNIEIVKKNYVYVHTHICMYACMHIDMKSKPKMKSGHYL